MFLEASNTLVLTFVGTEWALRRRHKLSWMPILCVASANVASLHGILDLWTLPDLFTELCLVPPLVVGLFFIFRQSCLSAKQTGSWYTPLALILVISSSAAVLSGLFLFSDLKEVLISTFWRKVSFAAVMYPLACFADLRRRVPQLQPRQLLKIMPLSLLMTAALFPVVMLVIAMAFLLLCAGLDTVGVDPHILNWPIYWGVLYGPFATFYWDLKFRFLKSQDIPADLCRNTASVEHRPTNLLRFGAPLPQN